MASNFDQHQQVNAWASYEQTAKNARSLSNRQQRRRSSVTDVRHSTNLSWHGNRYDEIIASTLNSRHQRHSLPPSSSKKLHRSSRILSQALLVPHSPSMEDHVEEEEEDYDEEKALASLLQQQRQQHTSGFFERLGQESGWDDPKLTSEHFEASRLTTAVRREICDIFAAFFEVATSFSDNKTASTKQDKHYFGRFLYDTFNATMPWTQTFFRQSKIMLFVDLCFRGISQVYFQNNPLSGLIILIGMFIQSTRIATHGVLALVSGNLAAFLLGFDDGLVMSGLFGYNSFLVGLALATFDSQASGDKASDYQVPVLVASIFFAMFSSILFVMLGKILVPYKSSPLTLPFNIATMIFLVGMANMGRVEMDSVRPPALPEYGVPEDGDALNDITAAQFFAGTIRGLGQVYLADNLASGILVLVAITVCSRICAMAALMGSAVGAMGALLTGVPSSVIENGMFGFNSSLAFTAMFFFYAPSNGAAILGLFAGIMAVVCQQALATLLEPFGLPFMTLPFCVATLPFVILQGTTSIVIAIPLATMTVSEDHYRKVRTLTDGIAFMRDAIQKSGTNDTDGGGGNVDEQSHSHLSSVVLSSQGLSRKMSRSLKQLSLAITVHSNDDQEKAASCSWCHPSDTDSRRVRQGASDIFDALDSKNTQHLSFEQVTSAFAACGLTEKEGLHFATLTLTLLDLDKSNTIEKEEFIVFAMVSQSICVIHRKISKFFDFVDENGNEMVDFDEIDAALEYLGQPGMSEDDKNKLTRALTPLGGKISDIYDFDMHIVDLINFVVASKVKEMVSLYHAREL